MNKRVSIILNEIENLAGPSVNSQTDEPMFYDFIYCTTEIRDILTPWYSKIWQKWKNSRPLNDSEIPF